MTKVDYDYNDEEVKPAIVACKLLQSAGLLQSSLGMNSFPMRVTDYLTGEWANYKTSAEWKKLCKRVTQMLGRS